MAGLETFDAALSERIVHDEDHWYDDGMIAVGKLAAALSSEDLVALGKLWLSRPVAWQRPCAETLGQARHTEAIALLLELVDRAAPEVSLAALESLGEFEVSLFSSQQAKDVTRAIEAARARPLGPLQHRVLEAFHGRLLGVDERGG